MLVKKILRELRVHAPFTLAGTVVGAAVSVAFVYGKVPHVFSERLFGVFHPLHVLFSAIVTSALYRLHSRKGLLACLLVGYLGAVAIGTLSDSLIPYLGEWLIGHVDEHVHGHAHIGFIDLWWIVNPLAIGGAVFGYFLPRTKLPHAGHVLLSTAASLFHMLMAVESDNHVGAATLVMIPVFLFLAVWIPCCTSDIVFPMIAAGKGCDVHTCPHHLHEQEPD